jgi:hypothetical protein
MAKPRRPISVWNIFEMDPEVFDVTVRGLRDYGNEMLGFCRTVFKRRFFTLPDSKLKHSMSQH